MGSEQVWPEIALPVFSKMQYVSRLYVVWKLNKKVQKEKNKCKACVGADLLWSVWESHVLLLFPFLPPFFPLPSIHPHHEPAVNRSVVRVSGEQQALALSAAPEM